MLLETPNSSKELGFCYLNGTCTVVTNSKSHFLNLETVLD